jgi:hypothetical protein
MICLGTPQMSPGPLDSEAAQLWIVSWFREYFIKKFPTGIVISELEYMGRTTSASASPTPLRIPSKPRLNQILDALSQDFRRWMRDRDYRKCDVLGIANDGLTAELLEVTTENNALSAITQVNSKVAILRETVNRIHNLSVDWRPSSWNPAPTQLFRVLDASPIQIRYICYTPTFRAAAPPGVILYEIHVVRRQPIAVPVPVPEQAPERLRRAIPNTETAEEGAKRFLQQHPDIAVWIRRLALLLTVAAVLAAIIALIDPVPGDEVAAFTFASALFRFATKG